MRWCGVSSERRRSSFPCSMISLILKIVFKMYSMPLLIYIYIHIHIYIYIYRYIYIYIYIYMGPNLSSLCLQMPQHLSVLSHQKHNADYKVRHAFCHVSLVIMGLLFTFQWRNKVTKMTGKIFQNLVALRSVSKWSCSLQIHSTTKIILQIAWTKALKKLLLMGKHCLI